jgi:hypothetical protein
MSPRTVSSKRSGCCETQFLVLFLRVSLTKQSQGESHTLLSEFRDMAELCAFEAVKPSFTWVVVLPNVLVLSSGLLGSYSVNGLHTALSQSSKG